MITKYQIGLLLLFPLAATAQDVRDKANFIEAENKFYQQIEQSAEMFRKGQSSPSKKTLKMDFSSRDIPKSLEEFKTVWSGQPVSQGATNTCWSFSTTSFYESEVKRISGLGVRLSEQYIVYYETIHKARQFVRTRGVSLFDEGSETNAVARMAKMYGMAPLEAYSGLRPGQQFLDHTTMFDEMKKYLNSVKESAAWDEKA
ncbi:MAG: peptidase C1, partial [Bacteroidota bacterium]